MRGTTTDVDVVIVGARCAGSALACYLRRHGASVLVLERGRLPSEHVLSTHTLHAAGVAIVDDLGLGAALREAPAMREVHLEKDGAFVRLALTPEQAEYCPRRERFDGLLQQAARDAGAELRDRVQVLDVLRDGDRVAGVRASDADGVEHVIHAGLVVGADGRTSTIAARVGAAEYLGYDAPRAMYWGYFPAPLDYPPAMDIAFNDGEIRVAFATERGQVLVGCLPSCTRRRHSRPPRWLHCARASRRRRSSRRWCMPSRASRSAASWQARFFLRRAVGPGWALVGDAGMHKEYLSGDGMSEASPSRPGAWPRRSPAAPSRPRALLARARQHRAGAFCFYKDQGTSGRRSAFEAFALARMARDPSFSAARREFEHRLSPYQSLGRETRCAGRWPRSCAATSACCVTSS